MVLPRAVLKWVQELDLNFSLKNPVRDLANGYLVAELMHRYHPSDIQLDTFSMGISEEARSDNWNRLIKVFVKHGLDGINHSRIRSVINYEDDSAADMLVELFVFLTATKKPLMITTPASPSPGYARKTVSAKLKDPLIERIVDDDIRKFAAAKTVIEHERETRQDRPLSILSRTRQRSGGRSGELHPIPKHESGISVEVKHIEIKAFNTSGENSPRSESHKPHETRMETILRDLGIGDEARDVYWFIDAVGLRVMESGFKARLLDSLDTSLQGRECNVDDLLDIFIISRSLSHVIDTETIKEQACVDRIRAILRSIRRSIYNVPSPILANALWEHYTEIALKCIPENERSNLLNSCHD
jgi:hypothetical protein